MLWCVECDLEVAVNDARFGVIGVKVADGLEGALDHVEVLAELVGRRRRRCTLRRETGGGEGSAKLGWVACVRAVLRGSSSSAHLGGAASAEPSVYMVWLAGLGLRAARAYLRVVLADELVEAGLAELEDEGRL